MPMSRLKDINFDAGSTPDYIPQVGDVVEVISNSLSARDSLIGETVTVTSIGSKTLSIKSDIDGGWGLSIKDVKLSQPTLTGEDFDF